jgi:hypothetical protein
MFKKIGLPILLGLAMLAPSALARDRDRDVRIEYRHHPHYRVYVGPSYHYGGGYYDRWGYWHPYRYWR